jgi:predicted nuclease of predicted toxin-antitoxin system
MNLSPDWVRVLEPHGFEALHWSTVGDPRATDAQILAWARTENSILFTHDLDFGRLLALTGAAGPSVIQVRAQDVLSARLSALVIETLRRHQSRLEFGALIVIDEQSSRARILPLR